MLDLARDRAKEIGNREACGRVGLMLTMDEIRELYIRNGYTIHPSRYGPAYERHIADWEIIHAATRLSNGMIFFEARSCAAVPVCSRCARCAPVRSDPG